MPTGRRLRRRRLNPKPNCHHAAALAERQNFFVGAHAGLTCELRHSSPASNSFRIPAIFVSLNFDLRI